MLGRGSFGAVYLAYDPELQREVALKIPRPDRFRGSDDVDRFLAEARLAAGLRHPGIVAIYDVVRSAQGICVVQEFVAGGDWAQWLRGHPQDATPFRVAALLAEVAEIVAVAHEHGLIHRDLKPANILMDAQGRPRVADFGMAIHETQRLDAIGERSGSPAYMSPEQARGDSLQLDGRSDIWNLGVMLYEALVGRRPFAAPTLSLLFDCIQRVEPLPPRQLKASLPMELERVCLTALAKRPADRYSTARDLAAELRAFVASTAPAAQLERPGERVVASGPGGDAAVRSWIDDLRADIWNFRPFLDEKCRTFCGRAWLFQELSDWLVRDVRDPAALVVGEPGTGKSAWAAELIRRERDEKVVAWYCCQADTPATLEPWRFVRHLAGQFAQNLSGFAQELRDRRVRQALDVANCRQDSAAAFEQGLLAPLHAVTRPANATVLVIVDALDESLHYSGKPGLIELLAMRADQFPPWLRLVATSRRDARVVDQLDGWQTWELNSQDGRCRADVDAYLARRLADPDLQQGLARSGTTADRVAAVLRERSEGNFLYVRHALDGLARGRLSGEQLGAMPSRLQGLYRSFMQRDFPDEADFRSPGMLLEVLLAAREPLARGELLDATSLTDRELSEALDRLAPYLVSREAGDVSGWAVFHASWAEWLSDPARRGKPFFVDRMVGERRLAEAGWSAFQRDPATLSRYALAHLPGHLAAVGRLGEVGELLTSGEYLAARTEAGGVFDLADDLGRAQQSVPPDHPAASWLPLIHEALARDVHFVARYPDQLLACLWNSGWWYDAPASDGHYDMAEDRVERRAEGSGAFSEWLSAWRTRRAGRGLARCWARSLRPPAVPLGTAQRAVLRGHAQAVVAVAWSPDGRYIASGSREGQLRIWDSANGRELHDLKRHRGRIVALSFAAGGRWLLSAGQDNSVVLWDVVRGLPQWQLASDGQRIVACRDGEVDEEFTFELGELEFAVRSAALLPDETAVVVGLRNGRLWSWSWGAEPRVTDERAAGSVYSVACSRDGRRVFSASRDGAVRIWDTRTWELQHVGVGHSGWAMQLAVSPSGDQFASCGVDGTIRLWDGATGRAIGCCGPASDGLLGVAYAADGGWLASAGRDGMVRLWDAAAQEEVRAWRGHTRDVHAVAFCRQSGRVASAGEDRTIRIWDPRCTRVARRLRADSTTMQCASFSADGRSLVVGLASTAETLDSAAPDVGEPRSVVEWSMPASIEMWDVATGQLRAQSGGHSDAVTSVAWAHQGAWFVTGSRDRTVRVWDAASAGAPERDSPAEAAVADAQVGVRPRLSYTGHQQAVLGVCISPDDQWVVSMGQDRTARVWDARTGQDRCVLPVGEREVWQVVGQEGGVRLASATLRGAVRVWDIEQGRVGQWCPPSTWGDMHRLAFSRDGRWVAGAVDDGPVALYDSMRAQWALLSRDPQDTVSCLSFSPQGDLLASGGCDRFVRVWDMTSGRSLAALNGHTDWVTSVAVSPVAALLASGGADQTVRIWDLAGSVERHCLRGHAGTVTSLAFSPEDGLLASGAKDHRVVLWQMRTGQLWKTLVGHTGWVRCLAFSPDGQFVVSGGDDQRVRVWHVPTGEPVACLAAPAAVDSLAIAGPRNEIVACGGEGTMALWEFRWEAPMAGAGDAGSVERVEPRAPRRLWQLARVVDRVSFSTDGGHLIGWDGTLPVRLWDAQTGCPLAEAESLEHGVRSSSLAGTQPPVRADSDGTGTVF
ncbi:MAG: protein kinase, partial [Pirellulaceae bacterium]